MTWEDIKNGPIPSLYYLGYRIVQTKRNEKKEIVVHFAKPENALEYSYNKDEMYKLCQNRLQSVINQEKEIRRKMKKLNPQPSLLKRIWAIICEIFQYLKC